MELTNALEEKRKKKVENNRRAAFIIFIFVLAAYAMHFVVSSIEKVKYIEKMTAVVEEMNDLAERAEVMSDVYIKVWGKSLNSEISKRDLCTILEITEDEYDNMVSDEEYEYEEEADSYFDNSLRSVYEYYDASGKIQDIKCRSSKVESMMKDLKNSSKKYGDVYESLQDMNKTLNELCDYAIYPEGSYISYNQDLVSSKFSFKQYYKIIKSAIEKM